jgi:cell wall assembly regulator SMI1
MRDSLEIEQVRKRFVSLASKGVECHLRAGATRAVIRHVEGRLQISFPDPVVEVWSAIDGLEVTDPRLVIYPIERLVVESGLLLFAECGGGVRLAFDTTMRNEANQWSIVNADTGYQITYTLGSFYCTRIWTWIIKRQPIWFHPYPDTDQADLHQDQE